MQVLKENYDPSDKIDFCRSKGYLVSVNCDSDGVITCDILKDEKLIKEGNIKYNNPVEAFVRGYERLFEAIYTKQYQIIQN